MNKTLLIIFQGLILAGILLVLGDYAQDYGYYKGLRELCPEPNVLTQEDNGGVGCRPPLAEMNKYKLEGFEFGGYDG